MFFILTKAPSKTAFVRSAPSKSALSRSAPRRLAPTNLASTQMAPNNVTPSRLAPLKSAPRRSPLVNFDFLRSWPEKSVNAKDVAMPPPPDTAWAGVGATMRATAAAALSADVRAFCTWLVLVCAVQKALTAVRVLDFADCEDRWCAWSSEIKKKSEARQDGGDGTNNKESGKRCECILRRVW